MSTLTITPDGNVSFVQTVPLCLCGCGDPVHRRKNGKFSKFIHGHNRRRPLEHKFWEKVDKSGDCWLWTAQKSPLGYGTITYDERPYLAHRVAYELVRGKIPAGLCVLQRCGNYSCVNPSHLMLGTMLDRAHEARRRGRMTGPKIPLRGENHPRSKFTDAEVAHVRKLRADRFTRAEISGMTGFSVADIKLMTNKRGRQHIEPEPAATFTINIEGPKVSFVWDDSLAFLADEGDAKINRVSHVEPSGTAWTADLSPVNGPVLGPFTTRGEALAAELAWLDAELDAGRVPQIA